MKAMIVERIASLEENPRPLRHFDLDEPSPGDREVLIRISACGVCHTELDEIEGRTPPPRLPIVPGHQAVGKITHVGSHVTTRKLAERVGVAWIFAACGTCKFCKSGNENLCPDFQATGRDVNGGYSEYMSVREDFCYPIPEMFSDAEAAPLLCAGAIGYRSMRLSNLAAGRFLGLTGFGSSAHLVLKMVKHRYPDVTVFVFARSERERQFACELGAAWAGDTSEEPPHKLGAVIDTTPAWRPDVEALKYLEPGGRLVINAIRKTERDKGSLLELHYPSHLWMEKEIKTVANVTRSDVSEFLQLAAEMKIKPEVEEFPLADANIALNQMNVGHIRGAKVLRM